MSRGSPRWKAGAPQKSFEQLLREQKLFGGYAMQDAVAAKFSVVQLKNPSSSGLGVLLAYADVYTSNNSLVVVNQWDTSLTSYIGTGYNRYLGATASTVIMRQDTMAAALAATLGQLYVPAGEVKRLEDAYIWLPEGTGIIFSTRTANTDLWVVFAWGEFEEY